jgi:hypothetical protein
MNEPAVIVWDPEPVPDLRTAARGLGIDDQSDQQVQGAMGSNGFDQFMHRTRHLGLFTVIAPLLWSLFLLLLPMSVSAETAITGTASVIDGDTIEIHGTRIRLHGIDAPESRQECARPTGERWRCGQQAALALADHIGRSSISCVPRDRDRYR